MATQKQVEFIKLLVHNLKLENIEYLNRDTSTMKPDVLNHWNNVAKRDFMSDILKLERYDEDDNYIKRTPEEVEAEYRRRTDAIENADFEQMSTQATSALIDSLKKKHIPSI